MTVTSTKITAGPYAGNGVTDTFSYGFGIEDKSEITILETDDNGVQTTLTVDADYTVNNVGVQTGGTVTRSAGPLPSNYEWYIRSNYDETQETDFESQGAFFPDIHEKAMDKLTRIIQQVRDTVTRSMRIPDEYSGPGTALLPEPKSGYLLRWLDNAFGFENVFPSDLTGVITLDSDLPKEFANVAAAVADTTLTLGKRVRTKARLTAGDRGDADYTVVAGGTGTHDDGFYIDIDNGFQLELLHDGVVNVAQFGAILDGVTDCSLPLFTAMNRTFNVHVEVNGPMFVNPDSSQSVLILEDIDRIDCKFESNILLPAGEINMTKRMLMSGSSFQKLTIEGVDTNSAVLTSVVKTGGTARNWIVDYTLDDASNVSIGDYIIITSTSGTGDYRASEGCFKVTGKVSNTITVKHTLDNSVWPTFTVTNATVWPLKTILRWPANTVGMAVSAADVFEVKNLILAGSFNVSTDTRTDSAADGLQVGASPNTPETGLNESQQTNDGSMWLARCGIVEWGGNGIQVVGGKLYAVLTSVCSNSWRGYQAARCGSLSAKGSSAVGNLNGYEAEENGSLLVNSSAACGNAQQGYFTIGTGNISAGSSHAISNSTHGFESKNNAAILADGSVASANTLSGVTVTSGYVLLGSNAVSSGNLSEDIKAVEGGLVNAAGASNIGVVVVDHDSGAKVIDTDGDLIHPTSLIVENTNEGKVQFTLTSIGDMNISFDPSNTGTFSDRLRIKNGGQVHPLDDNAYSFGRADFRWSEFFAGTGTINTSDEREKTNKISITDEVLDAWSDVEFYQYQWVSSVDSKGENARYHFGVMAQEINRVFESHGLDATRYGILCYNEWSDEYDDDGVLIHESGNRWGIRPDQCLFLESALMRRKLNKLKG